MDWIHLESRVYWGLLVAAFLGVAVWESFLPARKLSLPAERRWPRHGLMFVFCAAANTLVLRISPVAVAALVKDSSWGILNRPWLPLPVSIAATIVLLDLLQYAAHWTLHHVGILWRIHAVHHSDPDCDVSTAARFHPLELLCTQGLLLGAVALVAPPVLAVFAAEILRVTLNFWEHANASLPPSVEKLARILIVTPDLHRVHHSADEREQSRNLGQIFPWWDRLFGTYLGHAGAGRENFAIGLKGFQNGSSIGVGFMLAEPFRTPESQGKDPAVRPGPST